MTEIDNPFDGEADRIMRKTGATEQTARDYVVLTHLYNGNTAALAFWLERNYSPGPEVWRYLARMLQPEREDCEDLSVYTTRVDLVPFALTVKRRDGRPGQPRGMIAAERNTVIRELYEKLYVAAGRGSSDSVVAEIAASFDLPKKTIREAIKVRSPKSSGGKK